MSKLQNMTKEQAEANRKIALERFQSLVSDFKAEVTKTYFSFFERMPERYKRNWLNAYFGTLSSRKAIAAKCYECAGYEDVINNVGKCTVRLCPLWKYRPLQNRVSKSDAEK
jgi:hypothetical protein